jgi:hypothetical protein
VTIGVSPPLVTVGALCHGASADGSACATECTGARAPGPRLTAIRAGMALPYQIVPGSPGARGRPEPRAGSDGGSHSTEG